MEFGKKNWIIVIAMIITISIVVAVIALVIYDSTMTPSKQQDNLDKINDYLSRLIVGYSPS
jgi:uncharacterized protein YpmB